VRHGRGNQRGRRALTLAVSLPTLLAVFGLTIVFTFVPHGVRAPRPALADVVEIHSAHGASFVPALEGKRPLFILALGSDARPGQQIDQQRSDSIHLIGINPQLHRASVLGFPRDSWVPIPGHGTDKITTAMAYGGPDLTVRTIEALVHVRIDFWMVTSFTGLTRMVDGVGGVTVRVTQPMHDPLSGSNFDPGVHRFNGQQALAFARDRHSFLNGDLTRSANQGTLLLAALSKLHTTFARDPSSLFSWIATGWRNIETNLSVKTLLDLALTATAIPPGSVQNLVVPATIGMVGAESVVFILPAAARVYADMRTDGVIGP
jgi:LCP family protein required for cell wall assembly